MGITDSVTKELTVQEVKDSLTKLDVRKVMEMDRALGQILKVCSEQFAEKLHSKMTASQSEGKVPQDWNRV